MTLILTTLRCPDQVAPEVRELQGGEFSIGRGPENDWVLPDPDRHLSKRHCLLAYRSGGWQVADLSTNGTFLNRDGDPIGPGAPRDLNDGDRLRLGAYEIEVQIAAAAAASPRRQPAADPFALDPFAARPTPAFEQDPLLGRGGEPDPFAPPSINLPADYDPLAPEPSDQFLGPTASDHSPHLEDAFRPPRVLLPDDWDREIAAAAAGLAARNLAPEPFAAPAAPDPFAAPAAPEPFAAPITPEPFAVTAAPEPFPAPPIAPTPPAPPAAASAAPLPPAAAASPAPPAAVAAGEDLLGAFLRGAGVEGARPADPAAMMEALGAAFRETVSGLRQALIARAAIKSEFRIEQTVIRRSGNNPLKFSADDEDALAALLGAGRRTDMGAPAAIADALRDIQVHELATMSAMQSALRKLLAEFDPDKLRLAAERGGLNFTTAQKKAHAWDTFAALHARVVEALSDDFDSVFGKAFAQAYERALTEVLDKEVAS